MVTLSHLKLGGFLCDYMERRYDIRLHRSSFLFGNILPDFRPSFLTRPHYLENNVDYLRDELRELTDHQQPTADFGRSYSMTLGIVCHYYADFFCHAHSKEFTGRLPVHMEYESELHNYLVENFDRITSIEFIAKQNVRMNEGGVFEQFEKLHEKYLASRRSFGNDIVYTLLACVEMIACVTEASLVFVPAEVEALPVPSLSAV